MENLLRETIMRGILRRGIRISRLQNPAPHLSGSRSTKYRQARKYKRSLEPEKKPSENFERLIRLFMKDDIVARINFEDEL